MKQGGNEDKTTRIDKFLWAVRIYKTRSNATDACRRGKIVIDEIAVKPSRIVKAGDVIYVKHNILTRSFEVKSLLQKRVGAKLVNEYINEITPEEELNKLNVFDKMPFINRKRGMGRPTKKERRDIDKLLDW